MNESSSVAAADGEGFGSTTLGTELGAAVTEGATVTGGLGDATES